jgi:hypothetical protein
MRVVQMELYAPASYVAASPEVRLQVVNGCGPGGWKVDIVPDCIWGLDISAVCDIHDWMYSVGITLADKEEADRVFLNNTLRLIDSTPGWWNQLLIVKQLRRNRARVYFEAVHYCGGPAFWDGKNPQSHLIPATLALAAGA